MLNFSLLYICIIQDDKKGTVEKVGEKKKPHDNKHRINPVYTGFELSSRINPPLLSYYKNEVLSVAVRMRPGFNDKLTRLFVTVG